MAAKKKSPPKPAKKSPPKKGVPTPAPVGRIKLPPSEAAARPAAPTRTLFSCKAPAAKAVFLAGSFNDWSPTATPMRRADDGSWSVNLPLTKGRYEFKFVVDGKWVCDPDPARQLAGDELVANEHGTHNRVIDVR